MEEFPLFQGFQWINMKNKFQYVKLKQGYNDIKQSTQKPMLWN